MLSGDEALTVYLARVLSCPELFRVSTPEEARRIAEKILSEEIEPPLEFFGLRRDAVNEVLAVTDGPAGENVAPVGLRVHGDSIVVNLYPGSRTYENFVRTEELTACVVPDPIRFLKALSNELAVETVGNGAKVAEGTRAYLELEAKEIHEGRPLTVELRVVGWGLLHPRPRALVRGESALLEALVELTRIHLDEDHVDACKRALDVVKRTIWSEEYQWAVERVERELRGKEDGPDHQDTGPRIRRAAGG
ncbi:DUF447 domain-containing protein [Methanopyrus sp.]